MNRTKPTQSTLQTDSGQSITKSDLSKNSSQPERPESRLYSGEDSTHSTVYVLVIVVVLSIVGVIIGSVIFGIVRKRKIKKGINEQNVGRSNNKKAKEVSDESDNNKDKTK
jgi:beta-lactamase regulating signal transducer with metallopeptidase domain